MRIACTICARGGSKGVKNKNLRAIKSKPLLAYTLYQAKEAKVFSAIAVSSDSPDILHAAETYGATHCIQRPAHLATDEAPKIPAIQHCVEELEKQCGEKFDIVVDLDSTSPLRNIEDIRKCIELLQKEKASNVITASPARRSPYFNLVELSPEGSPQLSKKLQGSVVRRQDAPRAYDMNASIYVWTRETLFTQKSLFDAKTRLYVMPEQRSLDIDSEFDFEVVSSLMEKRRDLEF